MPIDKVLRSVQADVWEKIKSETRPLVVYGMGNGGDKLFSRLAAMGKTPAEVIASDLFVRGQSFHGYTVKRLSEIKNRYSDFVILVAFATRQTEVMESLYQLAERYTVYLPDMPVVEGEDFTRSYAMEHRDALKRVYHLLADSCSQRIFLQVLEYKLTGDLRLLRNACSSSDEMSFFQAAAKKMECMVDGGAYDGDTIRQMVTFCPKLSQVFAVEPDPKTFRKLQKFAADFQSPTDIFAVHAALWNAVGKGTILAGGNRNSSLLSSSYESRAEDVPLSTVDAIAGGAHINYIKYDVEGAELEALEGSRGTMARCHPLLNIALYHRSADLFRLPLWVHQTAPEYRLYLRRTACLPAWELSLYAI